jgi:DNA-binding HxlR family transcriptional regulator
MTIAADAPSGGRRQSSSENELVIALLRLLNRQMKGYWSYCPIAKAAEILTERWTLLVIRDLLLGARHFNDLRLSIPLVPPATLSKRLKALQDAGIIERVASTGRGSWEYRLTDAGEELKPFLDLAGAWGQRWVRSQLLRQELHPSTLMWDIHRFIKSECLPAKPTVIYFEFEDLRRMKRWWLVIEQGEVDVCLDDPGRDVDLSIYTDLRTLTEIFMGDLPLKLAKSSDRITLVGSSELTNSMHRWFGLMPFAHIKPGLVSHH